MTHIINVDPFLTPVQTALHFRDLWYSKYCASSNNIIHKDIAENVKELYVLAEKRVSKTEKGFKLEIFDFHHDYFDKNCPGFSNAIFLMETFYEDPSMFFENFRDVVKSHKITDSFGNLGD